VVIVPAMSRLTPTQVREIVSELGPNGETVSVLAIVTKIRELTGCSRATAYRGVADAIAAGALARSLETA
jgi:hypothetical protein